MPMFVLTYNEIHGRFGSCFETSIAKSAQGEGLVFLRESGMD